MYSGLYQCMCHECCLLRYTVSERAPGVRLLADTNKENPYSITTRSCQRPPRAAAREVLTGRHHCETGKTFARHPKDKWSPNYQPGSTIRSCHCLCSGASDCSCHARCRIYCQTGSGSCRCSTYCSSGRGQCPPTGAFASGILPSALAQREPGKPFVSSMLCKDIWADLHRSTPLSVRRSYFTQYQALTRQSSTKVPA